MMSAPTMLPTMRYDPDREAAYFASVAARKLVRGDADPGGRAVVMTPDLSATD